MRYGRCLEKAKRNGRQEMIYICVRTYGNGKHMNKVYNLWFSYLSQAERMCKKLNEIDSEGTSEKWIPMLMNEYVGGIWEKGGSE